MPRFEGINTSERAEGSILQMLQPGVLKGHGRKHTQIVVARIDPPISAKELLTELHAKVPMQTALDQFFAARVFDEEKVESTHFLQCMVSATAFAKLDLPRKILPRDFAFREGMKYASRTQLDDPPISTWNEEFKRDVDFVFVVASDHLQRAVSEAERIKGVLEDSNAGGATVSLLNAETLRDHRGRATDAFGFVDGISQPLFLDYDIRQHESTQGSKHWDPSIDPRDLVLVRDTTDTDSWGSYCAFRVLLQDRDHFETESESIARLLGVTSDTVRAQYFGRFSDGTPLELSDGPLDREVPENDFNYDELNSRLRCPLHSHIRKVNIRSIDDEFLFGQIARRGVPFVSNGKGTTQEGLMFFCFQKDISLQFEKHQKAWMNEVRFPDGFNTVGTDPVAATKPGAKKDSQTWIRHWNQESDVTLSAGTFSRCLGGEYLYLPPSGMFAKWSQLLG